MKEMSLVIAVVLGSGAIALAVAASTAPATATEPAATQPATAPTTAPATQPTAQESIDAEKMLEQLLRSKPGMTRPLEPVAPEEADAEYAGKRYDVVAKAPDIPLKREGDVISQRVGRLQKSADGTRWEFHFDSDKTALADPPMILLPNRKLYDMEETSKKAGRDLRFRVTGIITQYRGENYLLVEMVRIEPDNEGL